MTQEKIKKALQSCSEKKCDECIYNRWIYGVCQTHLLKDTLKLLESKTKRTKSIEYPQIEFDI